MPWWRFITGFQLCHCMVQQSLAPFFVRLGYVTALSRITSYLSTMIHRTPVMVLVWPYHRTSSCIVNVVTPTVLWTWLVCHLHVVDLATRTLLSHLLCKVSVRSMLAFASPTASTSSHLDYPPLSPFGMLLRSAFLAFSNVIVLILWCPRGRHIIWSSRLSFSVLRGMTEEFLG